MVSQTRNSRNRRDSLGGQPRNRISESATSANGIGSKRKAARVRNPSRYVYKSRGPVVMVVCPTSIRY